MKIDNSPSHKDRIAYSNKALIRFTRFGTFPESHPVKIFKLMLEAGKNLQG